LIRCLLVTAILIAVANVPNVRAQERQRGSAGLGMGQGVVPVLVNPMRRTTMPTTQKRAEDKDLEQHKNEILQSLIEEQVIHRLGAPAGLRKVQVRRLWDAHYRVNVLVGENAASAKITNSYFVESDNDGNIVKSNPNLTTLQSIR